jgi:hypothetical protein
MIDRDLTTANIETTGSPTKLPVIEHRQSPTDRFYSTTFSELKGSCLLEAERNRVPIRASILVS